MMARSGRRRAAPRIDLEILVESPLWGAHAQTETVARRTIEAVAAATAAEGELCLVLADDAAIRVLNRSWRGFDKATNVLSFPAVAPPGAPKVLGDVVLAYETVRREAEVEAKPFEHHLAHLVVHGFLHLLGYDHETESDAEKMERLECTILEGLGVSDPYTPPEHET